MNFVKPKTKIYSYVLYKNLIHIFRSLNVFSMHFRLYIIFWKSTQWCAAKWPSQLSQGAARCARARGHNIMGVHAVARWCGPLVSPVASQSMRFHLHDRGTTGRRSGKVVESGAHQSGLSKAMGGDEAAW
jgi:hypothetical protein